MRFALGLAVALLALLGPSCKHHEPLPPPADKPQAQDIPRDYALGRLRTLLPLTSEVICTVPKESLKPTDIGLWVVGNDAIEIRSSRGKPSLFLRYTDIVDTQLEKVGKVVHLRIYTSIPKDPGREHFAFVWSVEESAKDALMMFESVRKKPQ